MNATQIERLVLFVSDLTTANRFSKKEGGQVNLVPPREIFERADAENRLHGALTAWLENNQPELRFDTFRDGEHFRDCVVGEHPGKHLTYAHGRTEGIGYNLVIVRASEASPASTANASAASDDSGFDFSHPSEKISKIGEQFAAANAAKAAINATPCDPALAAKLRAGLSSRSWTEIRAAVAEIDRLDLRELTDDVRRVVRETACREAWVLLEAFGVDLTEDVSAALHSDHSDGRTHAIEVIGRHNFRQFTDELKRINSDAKTADDAAWKVLEQFDVDIADMLCAVLNNRDWGNFTINYHKKHALKHVARLQLRQAIDAVRLNAQRSTYRDFCKDCWDLLERFDAATSEDYARALRADDYQTRGEAVQAIGRYQHTADHVDALRRMACTDKDWNVCKSTWSVLDDFGLDLTADLEVALKADNDGVRRRAIEMVGKLGLKRFVDQLSHIAQNDTDESARKEATEVLGTLNYSLPKAIAGNERATSTVRDSQTPERPQKHLAGGREKPWWQFWK